MKDELLQEAPNVPTEERALASLKRVVELGELEILPVDRWFPCVPRYLVTYMKSRTAPNEMRSVTVVSVTNQSAHTNKVMVKFYRGFTSDSFPAGSAAASIPPQFTVDFASRSLPSPLSTANAVSNPELTYAEGRAIVWSQFPEIGVSARVYYTAGKEDERLHAITDSKVVVYCKGNIGD